MDVFDEVMKNFSHILALCLALLVCQPTVGAAGEATVATAANFAVAAERIAQKFQLDTGHVITLVRSSTGKLTSQVMFGAPFDVLLAADQARPKRLVDDGHGVAGSQFTYATGRLALWSRDAAKLDGLTVSAVLKAGQFSRLSIANPDVAPYGAAAWQSLEALGVADKIKDKLIYGENIQQAYAFAASGNTDMAVVALSFMLGAQVADQGAFGEIPSNLHSPILQDAVLLKHGKDNEAALAFLAFMKSPSSQRIMKELGYENVQQ